MPVPLFCLFCSDTELCLTLWDSMDCSMPAFPVLHCLLEFAQTHVHWVGDAIQPSHPLSPSSPPALNPLQSQGLFQPVSSLHQAAEYLNPFFHPRNKTAFLPILKRTQSRLQSDPFWSARVDTGVWISISDKLGSLLTQIIKTIERKVVVLNKMLKKIFLTLEEVKQSTKSVKRVEPV